MGALIEPMACGKKDYNIDFVLCQQAYCGKIAFLCGILMCAERGAAFHKIGAMATVISVST